MEIVVIIATKNRPEYFKRAFDSVMKQSRRADKVIVVSDSAPENILKEKDLIKETEAIFLTDTHTHNYAGSLNTAIYYLIGEKISDIDKLKEIYIAFLDDDDFWAEDYLNEAESAVRDEDFLISGLIYRNEEGEKKLSVPESVTVESFLKGNPHIQGSNTFVKLTTLLRAGLFDENMSSTTDRDIFTRIMLLNARYAVMKKYFVTADAFNSRERITNGKYKKADGLKKFYDKYSGIMTAEVKEAFFARAENLFGVERKDILTFVEKNNLTARKRTNRKYRGKLIIGFIVTDCALGLRLLKQLVALKRANTKIIIYINFTGDRREYLRLLEISGYEYETIDIGRVKEDIAQGIIYGFSTVDVKEGGIIKDICVSRSILHFYLYRYSDKDDTIWVLDEDMELKELVTDGAAIKETDLDIDCVISEYKDKYDAVVGNYTLDAPLPTLSILRVSLLDYYYTKFLNRNSPYRLQDKTDYYYDLTDSGYCHLETPASMNSDFSLDDIFSGKATSRPLTLSVNEEKEVKSRGGNTLIFNKELLKIPNWSIKVGDVLGRRSDYFWALEAVKEGYKIINAPFATLHNRALLPFSVEKEENKLLSDFIGASFTKAIEDVGLRASETEFVGSYQMRFISRLVKYVVSFYRINGLLSAIGAHEYLKYFHEYRLKNFIHKALKYTDEDTVATAHAGLNDALFKYNTLLRSESIAKFLSESLEIQGDLRYLGCGKEGAVFTDGITVWKYFFDIPKNLSFLKEISVEFSRCKYLYPLKFDICDGKTLVISYPYEKSEAFCGNHHKDVIEFLRFAKENGFVFDNFKKENFIVVGDRLKLTDYGNAIIPFDKEKFDRSVTRAYQMLRYPFLDEREFKRLIALDYSGEANELNTGVENFSKAVERRYKEDIHDRLIIEAAREYSPRKVLDYGAGKCKIANELALNPNVNVSVFDIDLQTITERAAPEVGIITCAEAIENENYDLVLSNLVLCCVSNDTADAIVSNIVKALKPGGRAVISICNPFFNNVAHTELKSEGVCKKYDTSEKFVKTLSNGGRQRDEYHRPIEFYRNLFSRNGLVITSVIESDGMNIDTLMPIAEYIVFKCKKEVCPIDTTNLSLLIKTNPMEHKSVYDNVKNIVLTLEKGFRFTKRIAVVDLTSIECRTRKYDEDNTEVLCAELMRASNNGLLDEIVYARNDVDNIEKLYQKYFGIGGTSGHSLNGQGLYATLCGFEATDTPYVFQTDSDIIYKNEDSEEFLKGLSALENGALTASIGVARGASGKVATGTRTEVRNCFLNLAELAKILPLPNSVSNGIPALAWHRALDRVVLQERSVRFASEKVWFIHPQNDIKLQNNFISAVTRSVEKGNVPAEQYGNVDLVGDRGLWTEKIRDEVVLFVRGYNTSCEKLKRLFDSLKKQTYRNFKILYLDDASVNGSAEYAEFLFKYDPFFKEHTVGVFNNYNVGGLENLVFVLQNVIINKCAIVINVDNDDVLVNCRAVEIIVAAFESGAELTVGNCVRYDKPLKYYGVASFDRVWERNGDNVWLHPKCFRRYLFDEVDVEDDLKIDGDFVEVNTDFAIMLPMINATNNCKFIDTILYYFEPSIANRERTGVYGDSHKKAVRDKLLFKAKEKSYGSK